MNSRIGLLLVCLLAASLPAVSATAQTDKVCPTPGWSKDFYLPGANGTVSDLAEYQGNLVVGGEFSAVGSVKARNVSAR